MALVGFLVALSIFGFVCCLPFRSLGIDLKEGYYAFSLICREPVVSKASSSTGIHVSFKHHGFRPLKLYNHRNLFVLFLLTANDVQLNPGPFSESIKISPFNARSIVNKWLQLQTYVSLVNPDIVAITETWLHDGVCDSKIFPASYIIHRRDRESRSGGVLLAIKSSSHCFRRCDLETECEIFWCEIPVCGSTSYFFGVF